ncbi:Uncharacterised protein [Vibrio cholerae]|nr:Uncharacterised protein [Vibrio cholerae]CSB58395.1 Uncharacterised protein [Vibrio cholerae]
MVFAIPTAYDTSDWNALLLCQTQHKTISLRDSGL